MSLLKFHCIFVRQYPILMLSQTIQSLNALIILNTKLIAYNCAEHFRENNLETIKFKFCFFASFQETLVLYRL